MKTLRKGNKNSHVTYLQEQLAAKGYLVEPDGHFGTKTETAVEQFQMAQGLKADGVVGDRTWDALLIVRIAPPASLYTAKQDWLRGEIPRSTSQQVKSVLGKAIDYFGAVESPDGSNRGPVIDDLVEGYNAYWKTGDNTGYPWCAMACSTWIGMGLAVGKDSLTMDWSKHPFGAFFGGTSQVESWAKKHKCFVTKKKETWPSGAVFTMSRGSSGSDPTQSVSAGHTAMIVKDNGDGTLTTIEANISNKVWSRKRKKSDLRGAVVWWKA